jgi:hypothetical protein
VQGPFFGYFLLGLEKKVTRLPAGTGEIEIQVSCFGTKCIDQLLVLFMDNAG